MSFITLYHQPLRKKGFSFFTAMSEELQQQEKNVSAAELKSVSATEPKAVSATDILATNAAEMFDPDAAPVAVPVACEDIAVNAAPEKRVSDLQHENHNLLLQVQALESGSRMIAEMLFDELVKKKELLRNEKNMLSRKNVKLQRWVEVAQKQQQIYNAVCSESAHVCSAGYCEQNGGYVLEMCAEETDEPVPDMFSKMEPGAPEHVRNMKDLHRVKRENDILEREIAALKEENALLKEKLKDLQQEALKHKAPCGCDIRSFKRMELEPLEDLAVEIYDNARARTEKKNNERNRKKTELYKMVYDILDKAIREDNKRKNVRMSRMDRRRLKENLTRVAREITTELLSVKDIGIHEVAKIIGQAHVSPCSRMDKLDIAECFPSRFRNICKLLEAKKSADLYFMELRKVARDAQKMNIPHVWREKEGVERADKSLMTSAARLANEYAKGLLGEHKLVPEIAMTNSVRGLQAVIRRCMTRREHLPVTEKNYKTLISAATKIRFMHLAETIKSQIDFQKNDDITEHLRAKLDAYIEHTEDGEEILNIGPVSPDGIYRRDDREDPKAIRVAAVEVGNAKGNFSVARKFCVKDSDGNSDYDTSKIYDFTRLRIMLTARDSQIFTFKDGQGMEDSPIQLSTEKILALLCAIFGSDFPKSRLRYNFELGDVNEYSTGSHRAFHITFRYRYQCAINGANGNGYPKMKSQPVEVQIVVFMDKKEQQEDHKTYDNIKDRVIQNIMGMNRSFPVWLSDLADVILDEKKLHCRAHKSDNLDRLTDREFIAKLLFTALTKRDESGGLENARALEVLFADEQQRNKLKKVAKKYLDYVPLAVRHRKDRGMEVFQGRVALNRLAAEVLDMIENYGK